MKKIHSFLFIIGITCIIGLFNWYATPTMSDDIMYRFVFQSLWDWKEPFEPILSIADTIKSQIIHYEYINGRSITHGMAQIALNLIPDNIAKLLNTVMFMLLIFLVAKYTAIKKENQLFVAIITFGLLFLVISGFYTGFIWLLGSFTYLWALVITMCFLLMLRCLDFQSMNWKLTPLIPLSFIMGWTHEAIALPFSTAFILYIISNRKKIFHQANCYCMIAYILGMMMIITSPSLWNRADIGGITLTQRILSGCVNILFGIRISWLLIATLIMILIKDKNLFLATINRHKYLIIAWITAICIVFSCGTSIERVPICADFIAMLLLLVLWQSNKLGRFRIPSMILICTVAVIVAIPAIRLNYDNYQNYRYHQQQLTTTDNQIIKVRQLPIGLNNFMKIIAKRYVNPTVEFNFHNCYMAFDQHDINNRAVAQLYHKDSVIFLPEDVVNRIQQDSLAYCKMESDEHENLYIMQLNSQREVKHLTFILDQEMPLKFYQRLMSYSGNEYDLDSFNYEVIDINNRNYLVMTIPTDNIRRRIKDVKIN